MTPNLPFGEWLDSVNRLLVAQTGLDRESHPDWFWREMYDEGETPESAVELFLEDEYGNEFIDFSTVA